MTAHNCNPLGCCECQGHYEWRKHSEMLNTVAWKLHDAMGVIPAGAHICVGSIVDDIDEICRLVRLGRQCDELGGDGR